MWRRTPAAHLLELEQKRRVLRAEAEVALRRSQRFIALADIRRRFVLEPAADVDAVADVAAA